MKNTYILGYGIFAFVILLLTAGWFFYTIKNDSKKGSLEAERTFSWITSEIEKIALSDGFMTDSFIEKTTNLCQQSQKLSVAMISTPSGTVFAWPKKSTFVQYDINGMPQIINTSLFMKIFSTTLNIGDNSKGSVILTSVLFILKPDSIFSASRNSFLIVLTILLITIIFLFFDLPAKKKISQQTHDSGNSSNEGISLPVDMDSEKNIDDTVISDYDFQMTNADTDMSSPEQESSQEVNQNANETVKTETFSQTNPEGLFSPISGIGWEQYLTDRLDAELIRAASSEQDLSLIVIRVSGLLHTDLLSKKIAKVLVDAFKFRDLVFELGVNGFAGILQNINLDQAMKIADELYAGIDSILMELSYSGQITIGITTRTARLLPAARMIEEALSAAQKAVEEPSLPIVAFRTNPGKYRNFVAENT